MWTPLDGHKFVQEFFFLYLNIYSLSKYSFGLLTHETCFDSRCLLNFDGFILFRANNSLQIKQRGCSLPLQLWNEAKLKKILIMLSFLHISFLFLNSLSYLRRVCSIIFCIITILIEFHPFIHGLKLFWS